ncbi:MAG: bifunctional DNA-formamidopyrimidine glycosylase/DNA-(apurinic or apyrimidinic site) lyase [Kiritimatiellae bacterium]|nr:bifunctional DNA-formamidopyrimidine glycosylase/DNA-(apurinic or apyrimidinic site) lyase [Kiritimatiellia bacterium]
MPELPEVETVVRGLRAAGLEGSTIREARVRWARSVSPEPAVFAAALRGRRFTRLSRRAKYIVADLDDGRQLLIHLRMTGKFRFEPRAGRDAPHDRVTIELTDGRCLHFNDTRKFGRIQLVTDASQRLAKIGPEPLEAGFTPACLLARLRGRRRMIKPLLLDQSCVAGLGNIYVDEALWQARIHPASLADKLSPAAVRRLHAAICEVLVRAVGAGGTTLGDSTANFYSVAGRRGRNSDNLRVFRRDGEPCPRCRRTLVRIVLAQRGTHICPHCQPAPGSIHSGRKSRVRRSS